jgi:hypothetical protein
MARDIETILTIHGLEAENKLVRADVFSRKLQAFLAGLGEADKFANGKRLHRFMIEDLKAGSAVVKVRERQSTRTYPKASGVEAYERAVKAVYNGERAVERLPARLVAHINDLSAGATKQFAHGEVAFDKPENVVRIDEFLQKQSIRAQNAIKAAETGARDPYFQGIAFGSFDGVLKVIDARGQTIRAKLVTTAGGVEIDCVVNRGQVDEAAANFDRRVRVEGTAHYDAQHPLPVRVDVLDIAPVKAAADLKRWRGAFRASDPQDEVW